MFSLFGAVGQVLYNRADTQKTLESAMPPKEERGLQDSWLNSKWSPMKVLSDEEYRTMLEDRLLRIEVQLTEVDESIEGVKRAAGDEEMRVNGEDGRVGGKV